VDAAGQGSPFVSLALDAQERPRVVYLDSATGGLRAALFDGAWTVGAVGDAADAAAAGARQIAWADLGRINVVGVAAPAPPKEVPGVRITIGGRALVFAATGEVLDGASQKPVGKWHSESAEMDNHIRYDLAGVAQTPLVAAHRLNDQNQLVLGLLGDGGATAEFAFQGVISVDANHHFFYQLIDDTGANTAMAFTVYASGFHFAETSNDLMVDLAGGGTLDIVGASAAQSLEAERNHLPQFRADDLLTFEAVTTNLVDGDSQDFPADLQFGGTFDLERDQLVFLSENQNTPGTTVKLGFAGKLKGVTAGFVYFADGVSTDVVLNIHGQHVFKPAGGGQTDLTWETTLGFSGRTFSAAVAVDMQRTTASGNILSLNGKLRLEKAADQFTIGPFDFELTAQYGFDQGTKLLIFTANVDVAAERYDLMLEGRFIYSNKTLVFAVQYSNQPNAPDLRVSVGIQGDRTSMIQQLSVLLEIDPNKAASKLDLKFEVALRMRGATRVKEIPPALQH
jgi:hypothetical protein